MPQFLAPICNDQLIDVNGDPLVGGKIETYLAGSTTPAQTYTDDSGSVTQANPIILNSLGYTPNPIWLTGGVSYKFVIKNAAGVIQRTVDDIAGVNDASVSQSEWVDSGFVPTYINATSFSVPGDQTTVLQIGRRVRTTNTSGLVYATISNSVFAAGITTVTLTNDSTTLDPGLSGVAYALLAASPLSVPNLPGSKISGPITDSGLTMNTARLLGRTTAGAGAVQELTGDQAGALLPIRDPISPISASVASNALTLTLNPTTLDFRSTTLGSGAVNTRTVSSPIDLVISSGSTLGTTNGALARLAVLAIDNAGAVELAVVNLAGGVSLNEEGLISTTAEGGAGAADSASTVYSNTARTNVPYRLLGFIESTQTTAGTWATAPSLVHASNPLAKWLSGYGQIWQDVSGSRALATTYTNSTGRSIVVQYQVSATAGVQASITINGQSVAIGGGLNGSGNTSACIATIPAGATYNASNANITLSNWRELR